MQWLELCAFTVKGADSIPGQGTKILRSFKPCRTAKKKIDKQKYKITAFLRYNSHNIHFKVYYTVGFIVSTELHNHHQYLIPDVFITPKKTWYPLAVTLYSTSSSAPVLPMNIQDLFPLGLTGLISLQCKGLSRVFSNTTVQKYEFFSTQLSLWSNHHIFTDYWQNHSFD